MQLATELVVQAGQSFRGAAAALAVLAARLFPTLRMPCANTIQSWVLRLGHYQLHRPLPAGADWAWLVDETLTIGPHKILAIVGCRLNDIPFGRRSLATTDLQLLHLTVLSRSTHETILPALQAAQERVGLPRAIVTDGGGELVKAIRTFRHERPTVAHVSDLAHVGANLLKKRFTADPRWSEFLQQLTQTNQKIRQTELAYLVSPRLRDKGRFMSVGVVLRFVRRVLYYLDRQLADARGMAAYGWLEGFRTDVERWQLEQQVVEQTVKTVRREGWHAGVLPQLESKWRAVSNASSSLELVETLRSFAKETLQQVRPEERLPGSTEALESCFGCYKRLVEAGPSVGASQMVLALGSVLKPLPAEEFVSGMVETPLKRVWKWLSDHIGPTMQKLRKQFHCLTDPAK